MRIRIVYSVNFIFHFLFILYFSCFKTPHLPFLFCSFFLPSFLPLFVSFPSSISSPISFKASKTNNFVCLKRNNKKGKKRKKKNKTGKKEKERERKKEF